LNPIHGLLTTGYRLLLLTTHQDYPVYKSENLCHDVSMMTQATSLSLVWQQPTLSKRAERPVLSKPLACASECASVALSSVSHSSWRLL
jgi:hypothetical protein